MLQIPEYSEILSIRLSKVLTDIGVDERVVLKKRRAMLLVEALENERVQLENIMAKDTNERKQVKAKFQMYYLGSQSEGTTTFGLKSDSDQFLCFQIFNVIQEWNEWDPYLPTYLMIQDENVSPGYCLLQRLRGDAPVAADTVCGEYHFKDSLGRILLKNNVFGDPPNHLGGVINGPAYSAVRQNVDTDNVVAFPCKSWPLKARFQQQDEHWWPSESMRRYFTTTGCFVVGVGRKGSEYEQFEWRISMSLAERCLIFNLNITQIRCYILMKMILKTFIKPIFKETISSYMCKTVLLHCISNTHFHLWKERNLYFCLFLNLAVLYNYIRNESCPQFFIPENNLMRGKISPEVKPFLLRTLLDVIDKDKSALFKIEYDGFGSRLYLMSFDLRTFNAKSYFSGALLQIIAKKLNLYMIFFRGFIKKNNRVSIQILTNPLFRTKMHGSHLV